ncbi:transporter [Salinibacter altiplanensis]|uniref:transporter n=1 Tax=Salinibacter altiplanensis TaxID=1803181 RepID=UPI000C9FAA1F|nr:transporter [Salinibacter altiplanensis]
MLTLTRTAIIAGFLLIGTGLSALAPPAEAQITTNTALPITQDHGIFRVQSKVLSSAGSGPMNREVTAYGFPLVGVYGINPHWAVFGVAPILDKNLDATTPQGRIERGPTGLGDARVFARYTVWTRNRAGQTQRLAPLAGLEVPTGRSHDTDEFGRLPQPLQLGSGSWDPFFGGVFTWQTLQWQVDVSPVYQVNTEANNFEFGDELRLDVASKYRLWLNDRAGGVPHFFYANLETNLVWQDKSERGGRSLNNSGGTTWLVAPGLQYITRRFVVEGAVQLPALQDRNGSALEREFTATLSLRINI